MKFLVVLLLVGVVASAPYHSDEDVNHGPSSWNHGESSHEASGSIEHTFEDTPLAEDDGKIILKRVSLLPEAPTEAPQVVRLIKLELPPTEAPQVVRLIKVELPPIPEIKYVSLAPPTDK